MKYAIAFAAAFSSRSVKQYLVVAAALAVCCAAPAWSQPASCAWSPIRARFFEGRFAEALPFLDVCLASNERDLPPPPHVLSMQAAALSYDHEVRGQILAIQHSFVAAQAELTAAEGVAREYGFDHTFLIPQDSINDATQGLIFAEEGRTHDAVSAYENGAWYGLAAMLELDVGDRAEARRLALQDHNSPESKFVLGALAEGEGNLELARSDYREGFDAVVPQGAGDRAVMATYFIVVPRLRAAIARVGPIR